MIIKKKGFQETKGFALFITIILITLLSFLSISIIGNQTISSNIDKLKYLYLQSQIHLQYTKEYINTHTQNEIDSFKLEDTRFNLQVISNQENNQTIYTIIINTVDDTTIRAYSTITK